MRAHLEGEADAARVLAEAFHVRLTCAAHERAADNGRLQQCSRLVLMDVLQRLQAHLFIVCGHPVSAHLAGPDIEDREFQPYALLLAPENKGLKVAQGSLAQLLIIKAQLT